MTDKIKQAVKNFFSSPEEANYMPQLNSLRAIAFPTVLLGHWLPLDHWVNNFPLVFGVTMFFVLSGFLITRILINSRLKSETKNESRFHVMRQYYIRRMLRIFPIYYITLFILYKYNIENIRQNFSWYFLYSSNIFYYVRNSYDGLLSPFWTLAVEEQFYIIWPLIILFIPKKYLFRTIIVLTLIGPLFRVFTLISGMATKGPIDFAAILTPAYLDSFGIGAILAYITIFKKDNIIFIYKFLKKSFFIFTFVLFFLMVFRIKYVVPVFFNLCINIISIFLIAKASTGFKGILRYLFDNPVLLYLGKISYGLYVYHNFMPLVYEKLGLPTGSNIYFKFFAFLILLVIISSLSWFFIEKPINNLKRYFKYT